jgi:antitoxin HicB
MTRQTGVDTATRRRGTWSREKRPTPVGAAEVSGGRRDRAQKVRELSARPYRVTLDREEAGGDERWIASVDELPGCTSTGKTRDAAVGGVQDAIAAWITTALEEGREVPDPAGKASYSGRLLLRMPRTLHGELTRAAEREGVSLNQLITDVLASAVNWQGAGERRAGTRKSKTTLNQEPGEAGLTARPTGETTKRGRDSQRVLILVLAANFVVIVVAAIVAIFVLIAAWV